MGKNKKGGPKQNVFKVAGAKSLKKTKAKAVNLGLKNVSTKYYYKFNQFYTNLYYFVMEELPCTNLPTRCVSLTSILDRITNLC